MLDYYRSTWYSLLPVHCSCRKFGLIDLPIRKYGKYYFERSRGGCYYCCCLKLLLHLGTVAHADCSTMLFGNHKRSCDGQ